MKNKEDARQIAQETLAANVRGDEAMLATLLLEAIEALDIEEARNESLRIQAREELVCRRSSTDNSRPFRLSSMR